MNINVSTQGISSDFTQANGDFESIERGTMDPNELMELLEAVLALQEPDYSSGEDLCQPAIYTDGPKGNVSFYLNEGTLYETESQTEVTPFDAVTLVTGHKSVDERVSNAREKDAEKLQYPAGTYPVRFPQLPPTNTKWIDEGRIDTGSTLPQIYHLVWKDGAWQGGFWLLLPFVVLSLMFLFTGFQKPVEILAVGGGGAGLILFVSLSLLIRKQGRNYIRMGFDWNTNTLWTVRNNRTHYLSNANCIQTIEIQKNTQGWGPGAVAIGDNVMPTSGKDMTYYLAAVYSSGKPERIFGTELQKKSEAQAISKKARMLF